MKRNENELTIKTEDISEIMMLLSCLSDSEKRDIKNIIIGFQMAKELDEKKHNWDSADSPKQAHV